MSTSKYINGSLSANTFNVKFIGSGTSITNLGWDINGNLVSGNTSSSSFTGGTVSGATIFNGGLTSTTISATTYLNLPIDIYTTGGTYSIGTATFTNNTGGTFSISGFSTGLTYFKETQNTSAPNTTAYTNTLSAMGTTTNVDFAIIPQNGGAILASIPDTGAVYPNIGGNKRGLYSIDLQRYGQIQSPTQVASGDYAAIISGYWNTASGAQSFIGNGGRNVASGANSVLLNGLLGTASGGYSLLGNGQNNNATGLYGSVLNGYANTASGNYSIASGYDAQANSSHAVALGFTVRASNTYAFAQGNSNTASGSESVSIGGSLNAASGLRSICIGGYQNVASAASSVAIGWNANGAVVSTANAISALAMMGGTASGNGAVAVGNSQATGVNSVALGGQYYGWNVASGVNSFATNANTYADALGSSSFGAYSKTKGIPSRLSIGSFQDIAPYVAGSSQASISSVMIQTASSAQTEMVTYNGIAIALILQDNEAIRVKGSIIGKQSGAILACCYDFDCVIIRGVGAGTTILPMNNMNLVLDTIGVTTAPILSANTALGGLSIKSGGKTATTIRWSARIDSTESILA